MGKLLWAGLFLLGFLGFEFGFSSVCFGECSLGLGWFLTCLGSNLGA
jgi:hypothetical protein